MKEEFSKFDLKILGEMQKDCSLSSIELSEKVGLSQSPCWRRLQRLKEEGYIKKQVALLDKSKFSSTVIIYAYLKMTSLTDEERSFFLLRIEAISEILECHTVFGEMDIMVKVMAYSMDWYQNFIFSTLLKLPGVKDVQSTVTLAELKNTTEIPLKGLQPVPLHK
ncbi:Lrp/AsnC family transcriptional regulator [Kordiimonas pumila]|uniref:Lrp/AsnC family transcriptional regulator n=1 Tax=Kordiimonas pumila TaxID=2161677 RepID=A0ABV7D2X7_9PROT|nr:Lrp/AsnC family transcriptional regulator [Kordiimonas pumila]